MLSSCISISEPAHTVFSIKHPKLVSSIPGSFKWRKCKCVPNVILRHKFISRSGCSFRIRAANVDFANEGNNKERVSALKNLLRPELMPKHLAVIMDGNRRWAVEKGLPVQDGHAAGGRKLIEMAYICHGMGIKVLTVFVFSTENWARPKGEVHFLMSAFGDQSKEGLDMALEVGARISIIGDTSNLPKSPRMGMTMLETITKDNKGPHLLLALNYGGRQDIIRATKAIATKVKDGEMLVEEIDDKVFEKELQTKCTDFPCPDLLIRTSGEKRLSNFMLWQLASTELHFVDKFFPDLGEEDLLEAIISFQQRKRRFGERRQASAFLPN